VKNRAYLYVEPALFYSKLLKTSCTWHLLFWTPCIKRWIDIGNPSVVMMFITDSVCIATRNRLDGPGIESRWSEIFSAPVQTGTETHPAYYRTANGSFPGINSRGIVLLTYPIQRRG